SARESPRTSSISRRSASESGRYWCVVNSVRLVFDVLAVLRRAHQPFRLLDVGDLDADHPALAVRVLVDRLGSLLQRGVDLGDDAGGRGEQLRDRLHRLDRAE